MEHYRVIIEGVEYIVEASSVAEAEEKAKEKAKKDIAEAEEKTKENKAKNTLK
jgi:hypothetical protein